MRCSVQNCTNDTNRTSKSHGITFHMFPKETNLRKAWVEALGICGWEPKERSTVCSEHFLDKEFYHTKCGLRKIKSGAVPFVMQESVDDLDTLAALKVCRVCLSTDAKMYHISHNSLNRAYEELTGMSLSDEDKFPQKVCWECAHRLTSCSRFKSMAVRSYTLMLNLLHSKEYNYLTVRDIKSINRTHHELKSSLIHKYYEPNDFDLDINEDDVIKIECNDDVVVVNELHNGVDGVKAEELPPIIEIEIKDEKSNNECFFEEFIGNFSDTDDDKKLSEVIVKPKSKVKKKLVKKKLMKKKKVSSVKSVKKKEEDDSPSTTMDKYMKSDVKRRKTNDGLDESLFTISTLTYEEQIAEIHKRQESVNYKTAPYKCTVCYRGFHIKDRYDAHAIRHSDASGAYECFICKTRLKTGRALRKHLTAQHTEKFSCKGCPFITRNRGVAREHEKWHAGTKYQCPHCPSEFDKLTTYMGHIRIKHVSDFVCELCGYTFVSKKGIEVHKKKKHRLVDKAVSLEGPYCELCDVKFVSEEAHSRHLKLSSKHSSDDDPNRIRNDSQSMNSERNGRVVRRVERRPVIHPRDPTDHDQRNDQTGPVGCEQCGMQLKDLRVYAQHFRRSHPDKNRTKYPAMKTPAMCELCGRIFQSMALLKDHMWVHTGEKRFKCDRCEKSFTQKTNLVFHMRVHSSHRPTYECPLCGKHFAFFNNRRRHMFIHTGLKPYKCETCGKCFTTSGEQKAHIEHVHLKKPWPKRARAHRPSRDVNDVNMWQKCGLEHMED